MRFLVDESAGPAVAGWLEEQGHDVVSVYDDLRGAEGKPSCAEPIRKTAS